MTAETVFFAIFALGAVAGAAGVLLQKHPVNAAISLIVSFFFLAGVYVLLHAHFMAVLQILVYAGAIMVLFLFVIMLLNQRDGEFVVAKWSVHKLLGVFGAAVVLASLGAGISAWSGAGVRLDAAGGAADFGTVAPIGRELITRWVLPFELAAVLLLVGIVGAMVVAKRRA